MFTWRQSSTRRPRTLRTGIDPIPGPVGCGKQPGLYQKRTPPVPDDREKALELAKKAYQLRPGEANVATRWAGSITRRGIPIAPCPSWRRLSPWLLTPPSSTTPGHGPFRHRDKEKARETLKKAIESGENFVGRKRRSRPLSACLERFFHLEETRKWPEETTLRWRKQIYILAL